MEPKQTLACTQANQTEMSRHNKSVDMSNHTETDCHNQHQHMRCSHGLSYAPYAYCEPPLAICQTNLHMISYVCST